MAVPFTGRTQAEKDRLLKEAIGRIAQGSTNPLPKPSVTPTLGAPRVGPNPFLASLSRQVTGRSLTDADLEAMELEEARSNAEARILEDPIASQRPDFLIKELEKIAGGGRPENKGIGGSIADIVGKTLGGIGYVMGRPLAVVASAGKEISDIASGQASFEDFFKQAIAKDTAVSKYLPKTGTGWLDKTIGFVADIAFDPLTYVTFGASQWAGREGRLNLASFLAKEENLAKAPSVLKKLEDGSIGRLGEWALDADELRDLGMRRGLSFSFGKGGVIGKEGTLLGKLSEGAATAVGKPFAKTRAALSDTGLFTPLQKITAKEKEKLAGLVTYGRRVKDSDEVVDRLAQLAAYNSAVKSNAGGRLAEVRLGNTGLKLVNDLVNYEKKTGLRLHEVLEGTRAAADETEQALADRTREFFDFSMNTGNEVTAEVGVKRGISPFLIERRTNYVPHVFSQEAKDLFASKKFADSPWASSLRKSLGMGVEEFITGPGVLRERTLRTGQRFLGKELRSNIGDEYPSLSEINSIAQEKLGVKLFEDNAGEYISNYVNSIVNQVKRITFVDSLFDYGPSVIRAITPKVVDGKVVGDQWQRTLDSYDSIVTPILDELSQKTQGILGPRLALAEAIISSEPGKKILSETQLSGVRQVIQQTLDFLREADTAILKADADTQAAYRTISEPLRARLDSFGNALATDDEIQLIKDLGLNDLYLRLYPNATSLPDAKSMAEDIVDGVQELLGEEYSGAAVRALENALTGAEQNLAGSTTSAVNRLKSELDSLTKTQPQSSKKIANTQKKLDFASEQLAAEDTLLLSKQEWDETVGRVYGDNIAKVMDVIAKDPGVGPAGEINRAWADQTTRALEALNAPGLAMSPEEMDIMSNILTQIKGMESQIALLEAQRAIPQKALDAAFTEGNIGEVADKVLKGWENIESLGVRMPPEMRDQLFGKVAELKTPNGARDFMKMYFAYNRLFKVSAMLTPGFVVRNGYTAAFNNFVFGTSVKETLEGLRFATSVLRNGVDGALAKVPAKLRGKYEEALKISYATGAGQTVDDILAPIISGKAKKLLSGKIVGKWSKANEGMELAARFSMALSSLNRGMSFESAVGNVSRYQFDYTNLSSLDRFMLNFIPFWTFASRNVPLQIVNQIARPKMYRMWESVQRNFPAEDQETMPEWLRQRGPVQLPFMPKGSVLNLDLPQLDMADQIRMFSDPVRLLSQANPLVKLPIELIGGRQLWSGVPFSEKAQPIRGPLDFPAYAAGTIFGDAGKMPSTGQYYTNAKAAYAIPNLLPTLAQLQRLIPELGGKEAYQDRAGSSRAAFFGLPYRQVSQDERFNELQRRQFAIRDYLSRLTRTGYLEPKEAGDSYGL